MRLPFFYLLAEVPEGASEVDTKLAVLSDFGDLRPSEARQRLLKRREAKVGVEFV
jgi:hypothetical protein